jgi:IS30 family transposase
VPVDLHGHARRFCSRKCTVSGAWDPQRKIDRQKAAQLSESGLSLAVIARVFGCCKQTIHRALRGRIRAAPGAARHRTQKARHPRRDTAPLK